MELILATNDTTLFVNNSWILSGTLYWNVQCLVNGQTSVSDQQIPRINPLNYIPITSNPSQWDFSQSPQCSGSGGDLRYIGHGDFSPTNYLGVTFTFKPNSTDPHDFLQYVINIDGMVTDYPRHDITDSAGKAVYINITQISRMSDYPLLEIWIGRSVMRNQTFGLQAATPTDMACPTLQPQRQSSKKTWIFVLLFIVIIAVAAAIVAALWWLKWRKRR